MSRGAGGRSAAGEHRRPALEHRPHGLAVVGGVLDDALIGGGELERLLEVGLVAAVGGALGQADRERGVGGDLQGERAGGGQQIGGLDDAVDQADALGPRRRRRAER
jgi:hypothetical protein